MCSLTTLMCPPLISTALFPLAHMTNPLVNKMESNTIIAATNLTRISAIARVRIAKTAPYKTIRQRNAADQPASHPAIGENGTGYSELYRGPATSALKTQYSPTRLQGHRSSGFISER